MLLIVYAIIYIPASSKLTISFPSLSRTMPASAGSIDWAAVRRSAKILLEEEGDPDDFAEPASTRVSSVRVHHNTSVKRYARA